MRRSILLLGVSVFVASLAVAATTSRLTGTVVDQEGVPLPGVTVTLTSEVLIGGPQVVVTDAEGAFQFVLLPPGLYLVRTDLPGFVAAEADARVGLDRVTEVRVQTAPAEFSGSVEVTAEVPVVDTTQVSTGASFDEEFLRGASVGVEGRSFLSVVGNVAGVVSDRRTDPSVEPRFAGGPRVMGGRPADNVYLIDGLNNTDAYYGNFTASVNFDAVREVSVRTSGYEAEYGQALGAVINVVTKSGGNSFSGSLDLRYRDESLAESGDHFDPEEMANSLVHLTATLGGPILRDRLWFFAAAEAVESQETPSGSPLTRQRTGYPWTAKLTWQVSDGVRATFKAVNDEAEFENYNAGPFVAAEAGVRYVEGGSLFQAELDAVPSEEWLLSVQVGSNRPVEDGYPMSGDLDTPARVNEDAGGLLFSNYEGYYENDVATDQARASATLFVDDLAGSHQVKAGVEYRRLDTSYVQGYAGGGYHNVYELYDPVTNPDGEGRFDLDGDGYTDHQMVRNVSAWDTLSSDVGDQWSAYLQDGWQALPSLTVKPGVRLDRATYTNTDGVEVADFEVWQPRLGVAWDLSGSGRTVARASWGRFMHPTSNNLPSWVNSRAFGTLTYTGYEHLCQWPGTVFCDREWLAAHWALDGQEVVTIDAAGNEHYWYLKERLGQDPFETVDTLGAGRLEPPQMETLSLAFEQQLGRATSVSLEYVKKESWSLLDDTCSSNDWVWDGSVRPASVDDPSTYTVYTWEGCPGFVLANVPGLRRDYDAVIASLDLRTAALRVMGSYTYSHSEGNSSGDVGGAYLTGEYDAFPLDFHNVSGFMDDDARHRVKLNGFWTLPLDFTVSFDYQWESASALDVRAGCSAVRNMSPPALAADGYDGRIYDYCYYGGSLSGWAFLAPRGSRRTPGTYDQLDLGLSKGFRIRGTNLEVSVAVVNVFGDEEPVWFWTGEYGVDHEWGEELEWSRPRRYEVGLRLEF